MKPVLRETAGNRRGPGVTTVAASNPVRKHVAPCGVVFSVISRSTGGAGLLDVAGEVVDDVDEQPVKLIRRIDAIR